MQCYPLPDVADMLDVPFTKVRQYVREHKLLTQKNDAGIRCVPELFLRHVDDHYELIDEVVGTALILLDGGFSEEEACRWLISHQELLGGSIPLELIRTGKYHQVNTVASMMAF